MIKRIVLTVFLLLFFVHYSKAQFTDDFERYNHTQRISPQSLNWITWSEDPETGDNYIEDEDGIVINTDDNSKRHAHSGKQALLIAKNNRGSVPQDVVLDLHNKSTGLWELSWMMYIPGKKREAYYNFQENTPIIGSGNWAIQVYFKGRGKGRIEDDNGGKIVNFTYPSKKWFELKHTIDLDNDRIKIELITKSESKEIYNAGFLSNNRHLGGVDFYSISENNKFYIDDVVFKKTGQVSDIYVWNNNRWEDTSGNVLSGVPDTSFEVILKEPFTVGTSTSETTLNCLNLNMENGVTLAVPSQKNVVVSGDLIVPSGNRIIVENNGSFVMLNNTAVIDMPDPHSFEYTRTTDELKANDYTYWTSMVEDSQISDFGSTYIYSYNTSNFIDHFSGYGYPQTSGEPDRHDDNGDDWNFENQNNPVIAGKGYAVLNPGGEGAIHEITFSGIPINGYISVPVSLSGDNSNDHDDWNLIGNPYPSAIDAKVLINSNINTSGTLYFWTHKTVLGGGNNNGPQDKNYNFDDYAVFNLSGGIAAQTGGFTPNGYIAAGQGFFMDVADNGEITFNNDMRVKNSTNENTQFFKSTLDKTNHQNESVKINKIWLNFSNSKGVFSQSLIAFLPGATDNFEENYDGIRAGADLHSKFYSVLGDKELAIQGKPVLTEDVQIPLGYYITTPDDFVISIDQLEGIISGEQINVLLTDHELNIVHDLKKSDYHFNVSKSGTDNQRFTLQVKGAVLGTETITKANNLIISHLDNYYTIKTDRIVKKVWVYDIMGRLLKTKNPDKELFNLQLQNIKKGTILIFKIKLENGSVLNKKMIQF